MNSQREDIVRQAVLAKLGSGFEFFTADDILAVAAIEQEQLKEISESIPIPPLKDDHPRKSK